MAGGKLIDLNPNYATPAIIDYDNDGKLDIIIIAKTKCTKCNYHTQSNQK